jgi:hypothetical protein
VRLKEAQQCVVGHQRAHRMQPGTAVGAHGGQEGQPDAELVQQPVAGLGQVRPDTLEFSPPKHGRTLWHPDR